MNVDLSMALGILAIMFLLSCIKPFLERAMGKRKTIPVQAPLRIFGLLFGILIAIYIYPQGTYAFSILLGIVFAAITDGTYAHFLSRIRLQVDKGQQALTGPLPTKKKVLTPPDSVNTRGRTTVVVDQPSNENSQITAKPTN